MASVESATICGQIAACTVSAPSRNDVSPDKIIFQDEIGQLLFGASKSNIASQRNGSFS